ncbi:hypothetical protein [Streptomyces sp. NPDC101132]|uniref:hypothetical protein n=1 Tax=Streptomyces sp. NPDC101132 TaxID=3366110 RepID=UPI0038234B87
MGGIELLFSLVMAAVVGPFVALLLGAAQAVAVAVPPVWLGRTLAGRYGGPALLWALGVLGAGAAVLAGGMAALGSDFLTVWAWSAGLALLPLVAAELWADGDFTQGRAWRELAAIVTVPASVMAVGTASAHALGPFDAPRPSPRLGAHGYVGTWSGGGGWLRLEVGGRAVVTRVPYQQDMEERTCTGEGTWSFREARADDSEGVDLSLPCSPQWLHSWEVAGTADRPELFLLIGDPDYADVRVLRKHEGVSR